MRICCPWRRLSCGGLRRACELRAPSKEENDNFRHAGKEQVKFGKQVMTWNDIVNNQACICMTTEALWIYRGHLVSIETGTSCNKFCNIQIWHSTLSSHRSPTNMFYERRTDSLLHAKVLTMVCNSISGLADVEFSKI